MDNASKALQFTLTPCPRCGRKFTPADTERLEDGTWALLHDCPIGPGKGIYCYGWNLRMLVQNWNEYIERWWKNGEVCVCGEIPASADPAAGQSNAAESGRSNAENPYNFKNCR